MNNNLKVAFLSFVFLFLVLTVPKTALAVNSPEKISTTSNEQIQPAVTTDSDGKVHTVWIEDLGNGTTNLIHRYWNGQVWSSTTTIASGAYSELPSITAGANNNLYLTWDSDAGGGSFKVRYSSYNGTSWSSPIAITPVGDESWDSEVTIDSSGNPHVAYTTIPSGTIGNKRYTYYTRYNGSSWITPVNITESGTFHQYPAIGADKLGNVHIVWKSDELGQFEIFHRMWNGSSFTSTASISGVVAASQEPQPRIAIDNANNAHVVWEESIASSTDFRIMYSKRNGSGTWSTPFTVSSVAQQTVEGIPSVAILRSSVDDVLVGWIDKTTDPRKLGFRKFNASSQTWDLSRTNNIQQASPDFPVATMDKWDNVHVVWGEASATGKYETYYDAIPLAINLIGPSGGTLTTFNGDTLTIPSGALSQNTLISAQITPLSNAAPNGSNTVNRQYVFEPSGQTFSPAASIVFTYTDAEVSGIDERTLGIYVWDSTTSQWVFKTGSVNRAQNKITLSLDHFSIWGFFGSQNNITWQSPLSADNLNEVNRGKTLPIKFSFTSPVADPQIAKLLIVDESGIAVKEFSINANNLRFDPDSQKFIANLKTDTLQAGNYQAKVFHDSLVRGSIDLAIN